MIISINGMKNNKNVGTYWLIGWRNKTVKKWRPTPVGADKFLLHEGIEILFWYGKPSKAPFELKFNK